MQNKIGIYAICKNENKFVDEWIANVLPADYICVLDTGSTDGTYEHLQEYQKQYPEKIILKQEIITPWRFDVARNKSMELVPDEVNILFSTDFDEKLDEGWADIIKAKWTDQTQRGYYKYAWSHLDSGIPTDIFVYDKMHSRDYYWRFPVHEVLWPKDYVTDEVSVDFGDDFMLQHYPDKSKDRKFYFDLLKLAVEENPDDCHERMLLAREYIHNNDDDSALTEYLEVLKMPTIDLPRFRYVLLESLGRCADIYKRKHNYDEAIWYCQEWIKEDPTYREPYLILGEMYNDMGMYTLAEAMIEAMEKHTTRKYIWVERNVSWLSWPLDIMAVAQYKLGNIDKALEYGKKVLEYEPNNVQSLKNYSVYLQAALDQAAAKIDTLTEAKTSK